MKQLRGETDLAAAVVELAMRITRLVRSEVRRNRRSDLSVSQIRALGFLEWSAGASLAEVAEHLGLGNPSTSKLMDDLVRRGLVERGRVAEDRRRISLTSTEAGRRVLAETVAEAYERVGEGLADLTEEERVVVERAVELLESRIQATCAASERAG